MYRSHSCGQLRASDIGKSATLSGWVHSRRDHGGVLFIDLRDREGLTQVVFNPDQAEIYKTAETLRSEFVIKVTGPVRQRPGGTENAHLATGAVEVAAASLEINASKCC